MFARVFDRALSPAMERELPSCGRSCPPGSMDVCLRLAGNGASFAHYPPEVTEVVALEPESYLRSRAELAAATAPVRVRLRDEVAEMLQADAASFDASHVLCSVADPARALPELRRVPRPAGELCLFEHVRSERPLKAAVQDLADRSGIWPLVAGGCHRARETVDTGREALLTWLRKQGAQHSTKAPT